MHADVPPSHDLGADMAETVQSASPPTTAALSLRGVRVAFGDFVAVDDVDLEIRPREFLCLLGPSGCGKSTLLALMAGFAAPSHGTIDMDGQPITGPRPELGVVFQSSDALFDWLTVADNIAFGPRMRGMSKAERAPVVDEHLKLVGLSGAAGKRPPQLSGGMRQRVQIARVLANSPAIVLMDEPFGALDAQTRTVMQRELDRIWRDRQCTVVFVTHDIDEALILADRIAVMSAGPKAGIKSVYEVGLPRPRDEDSASYVDLRHRIREDITVEVEKSMGDRS
jgi:NitT/TauT family transport system ATP-binding protein